MAAPRGVPDDYYARTVEVAHRRAATVILDCRGEPFRVGLAGRPDVVKPNLEELQEAVGSQLTTLGTAAEAAAELIGRGARAVLLSLGAHGALLVTPDGRWHATGKPERVVSTIGADDALLAGFVAGGAHGPDALGEAVAWATAAVSTAGSYVPVITDAHRRTVTVAEHVNATHQLA